MKTEYEAKVLDIDKDEIEKVLKSLGAKFVGKYEQKRYTYDLPKEKDERKWIRLRSDGKTTTLCLKHITSDKIDGTREIEFVVPDFDQAHEFLENIGRPHNNYQENTRTRYELDGVEVDIDEWPLIPTYLEIEGKNEQEVLDTIKKLGLSDKEITSQNTIEVYQKYNIDLPSIKSLKF